MSEPVTIRYNPDRWTITHTDTNDTRPNLHTDLIRRGYDGNIYTLARITTGRMKPRTATCYRTQHGEYIHM